jgi:hypothetical protein
MIHRAFVLLLVTIFATAATRVPADDVLQKVPADALAFAVLNNLDQTDAKVAQLLESLNAPYPTPATFIAALTGIRQGLDRQGDLLLAVLPSADDDAEEVRYSVWLPVADYGAMLTALDASRGEVISGIVVAGEDLIIAKHGDYALIMDPDARDRMQQILESKPSPPKLSTGWSEWIDANDIAVVTLPSGTRIGRALLKSDATTTVRDFIADNATDDGDAPEVEVEYFGQTLAPVRTWLADKPELRDWLDGIGMMGVAARIDEQGSATISARLIPNPAKHASVAPNEKHALPPALFQEGEFVVAGAGRFSQPFMQTLAATYGRNTLSELRESEQVDIKGETADQFLKSLQTAAADITAWTIAMPLGEKSEGLYTNNLLAVRVTDTKAFLEHSADVMEQWNRMHRDAESGTRMVFDIEQVKLGDRDATQYSLDVANLEGMPAIPEIRQAMERFFGPGGKLRAWVVPVDDDTVLLAAATETQVKSALERLDQKKPADWNQSAFAATNALLPPDAMSRVFLSLRGQSEWNRRQMEAMNGAVIGGKRRDIPESPPIGFSMQVDDREISIDAAVPRATIEAYGSTMKGNRAK